MVDIRGDLQVVCLLQFLNLPGSKTTHPKANVSIQAKRDV